MHKINIVGVGVVDLKIVDKAIEDQSWGFVIHPNFEENGTNLRIRFQIELPIDNSSHIFCKTITDFFLEFFNADYLKANVETIAKLIQVAMANTRLLIMQTYSEHNYIPMYYVDDKYFEKEVKIQISELKL